MSLVICTMPGCDTTAGCKCGQRRHNHDALRAEIEQLRLRVKDLEINSPAQAALDEIERLTEVLQAIKNWSRAYPIAVFPEPDLKKAHELLKAGGMTLDAIRASAMRHVITQVDAMARRALEGK